MAGQNFRLYENLGFAKRTQLLLRSNEGGRHPCRGEQQAVRYPAAKTYGDIVANPGYSRRKLLDRMIAAQALVHRATLVTFNPDDFSDVPGLSSLVWPSQ